MFLRTLYQTRYLDLYPSHQFYAHKERRRERTRIVASSMTPRRLFAFANLTASLILVHLLSSSILFAGTILPSGLLLDSPQ